MSTNTIERYWRSRVEMVADAVQIVLSDVPVEDTGSFRNDCETYLGGLSAVFADPNAMPVITQLINESARDPDLALALRSHIVAPRRGALLDLIARAVTRASAAREHRPRTLADLLVAPLYYRALVSGEPVTTDTAHRIVSAVLDGSPA